MSGASPASRNGQARPFTRSPNTQEPLAELLVDSSNANLDHRAHLHRHGNIASHGQQASCQAEKRSQYQSNFSFQCRNGDISNIENTTLHIDGQFDDGGDATGLFNEKILDTAPSPCEVFQAVPHLAKKVTDDTAASDQTVCLEVGSGNDIVGDEDLIDLSSDVQSCESEATVDPQSQPTPDEQSSSSIAGVRARSMEASWKSRNLSARLRPTQRVGSLPSIRIASEKPDRLTGSRRPPMASREAFLMSKPVSKLTRGQKLYRRRTGMSDPFDSPAIVSGQSSYNSQPTQQTGLARSGSARATRVPSLRGQSSSVSNRRAGSSTIWSIGGRASLSNLYSQADTSRFGGSSRTPGRIHASKFLRSSTVKEDRETHEKRLALALDVDQAEKVLALPNVAPSTIRSVAIDTPRTGSEASIVAPNSSRQLVWRDNTWMRDDRSSILEAPLLRDDFYCSVLAYSFRANRLAVALGLKVYLWSEGEGTIETPSSLDVTPLRSAYVASLAFSSDPGGRAILAVGRGDGRIILWSPLDQEPRFLRFRMSNAAAHLSFRPSVVRRPSQRHASLMAENEVLLVGDDIGVISVYFVEWPEESKRFLFGWHGSICLHARIIVHTQQICGIAWSPNGDFFATGGNDNLCCLFQNSTILGTADRRHDPASIDSRRDSHGSTHMTVMANNTTEVTIRSDHVKNQWKLNAAVKAIAFCPWQPGLLAAGGGSNDRCVHFYHTFSGACLAIIDCAAQVTALVWSVTRREIAATLGFAQPEHPFRVVVYSWPSCEQVVAIPWMSEMRALHAIAYPCRPDNGRMPSTSGRRGARPAEEGCIVIAGSDGSIKFHEVWSEERRATAPHRGLLGGSDILESLHGIDKEGTETIR